VVPDYEDAVKDGAIGVDLNAGHLSLWRLEASGNPVGTPKEVPLAMDGHTTSTRDGHLRAAISETLRYARECGVQAIVVEDLGFDDGRAIGRETMGRGQRGKRFRRDVAGIPTAKFKTRLVAMASRMGIAVVAVDPAYTSKWGEEHWKKPLSTEKREVSRHEAAAIVIGEGAACA